jgi:hypothetical protein
MGLTRRSSVCRPTNVAGRLQVVLLYIQACNLCWAGLCVWLLLAWLSAAMQQMWGNFD